MQLIYLIDEVEVNSLRTVNGWLSECVAKLNKCSDKISFFCNTSSEVFEFVFNLQFFFF